MFMTQTVLNSKSNISRLTNWGCHFSLYFCSPSWTLWGPVAGECRIKSHLQKTEDFKKPTDIKIDMLGPSPSNLDHPNDH